MRTLGTMILSVRICVLLVSLGYGYLSMLIVVMVARDVNQSKRVHMRALAKTPFPVCVRFDLGFDADDNST